MGQGITSNQLEEGVVTVLSRTVELTNAQIKALPTQAIEIIPAPGVGRIIAPLIVTLVLNNAAGAYANATHSSALYLVLDPAVGFQTGSVLSAGELLSTPSASWAVQLLGGGLDFDGINSRIQSPLHAELENTAIGLAGDNAAGDFTGGHASNSLKVVILYTIIDL